MLTELTHKELLQLARTRCIPPLLPSFHKGQAGGRICVIGGCEDYTGAPYFSANAAALMGCDLTHVICERSAATVIKSYTPNLMVHPYLRDSAALREHGQRTEMDKVKSLLDRMHTVVIGPGLGRDEAMLESVKEIIRFVLEEKGGMLPLVIDADGLFLISQDSEVRSLLQRFPAGRVVITPNVVEFRRVIEALGGKEDDGGEFIVQQLNCIVVQKGREDKIFYPVRVRRGKDQDNGMTAKVLVNKCEGSPKRVGGQGDTLSGAIACMLTYSRVIHDFKVWRAPEEAKVDTDEESVGASGGGKSMAAKQQRLHHWTDYAALSCYVGSSVTRECARLAFAAKGRAMQTTDLNDRVGEVYAELLGQ